MLVRRVVLVRQDGSIFSTYSSTKLCTAFTRTHAHPVYLPLPPALAPPRATSFPPHAPTHPLTHPPTHPTPTPTRPRDAPHHPAQKQLWAEDKVIRVATVRPSTKMDRIASTHERSNPWDMEWRRRNGIDQPVHNRRRTPPKKKNM